MTDRGEPAISLRYTVEIDGADLGVFSTCEGLGCELVLEQREEGGNNGFVWQLPTRIKYSNIKLTRPICKDSEKLTALAGGLRHWRQPAHREHHRPRNRRNRHRRPGTSTEFCRSAGPVPA